MDEIMTGVAVGGFLSLLETTRQKQINHILDENPMAYSIPNEVITDWLQRLSRTHNEPEYIQLFVDIAKWGRQWAEKYPR
jgi:hypothetical protein